MGSSNYTRTSYLMALFTERYTSAANSRLINPRLVHRPIGLRPTHEGERPISRWTSLHPSLSKIQRFSRHKNSCH